MRPILLLSLAILLTATAAQAGPKVIASVVPVHSIVAAVMGETGQPELLLQGQMSEHRSSFTPRQIADLGAADLVFMVGHGLEAKLAQLSGSEAVNGKAFIALSEAPGLRRLPVRGGGVWEGHAHEDEAAAPETEQDGVLAFDPHVWLDPENAKVMAMAAATELATADPANASAYAANASAFAVRADRLSQEIAAQLAPVRDKPFVVFHDAYHYFEARYGLDGVGSISDVSAQAPSAERMKEVRDKIASAHAICVFREPQYDGKLADAVLEGTGARAGVLDPVGATLAPGPGAYEQLLRALARDLVACLSG